MHWQEQSCGFFPSPSCLFCCVGIDKNLMNAATDHHCRRRHHYLTASLSSSACLPEQELDVQQANNGLAGGCKALWQQEETRKKRRRGSGEVVGFLCLTDTYYWLANWMRHSEERMRWTRGAVLQRDTRHEETLLGLRESGYIIFF